MLMRGMVSLFHLVLAAVSITGFSALLAQARWNMSWERAFYGEISYGTEWLATRCALGLLFGLLEAAVAIAFLPGGRAAGHAMVGVSMLLAWTAGWPLNLLLGLAGVAGALEVWSHMPAPEPSEEESEED